MTKVSPEEQTTINALQANWVWTPNWTDDSPHNTAGRVVRFTRNFSLSSSPTKALLHFSADTRYKLFVNGVRVAVGPTRSSPWIWYYDTLDIAPYLRTGTNIVQFDVIRYFAASRGAMPFQRTAAPGLTVVGRVESDGESVVLDSAGGLWEARVDESVTFPMGRVDDVFLHISERISPTTVSQAVAPVAYGLKTLNGELAPWRLRPRPIPMYEESQVAVDTVRSCQSPIPTEKWISWLTEGTPLTLPQNSSHTLEIQADVHSTAFLRWTFQASKPSSIRMKVTYSEGYELEPRAYPFFRTKKDRLDATGHLIGPFDEVDFNLENSDLFTYEPFWFRTFRLIRLEVTVGPEPITLTSFTATQVNYPLSVKANWEDPSDTDSKAIWDVSIRTLRNCMFDGYSDCPFYEQLQYSGDSRQVGLFHYLLSGDDRLMRQAVTNYAASIVAEGLTQSRFPSHVPQVIAGFSLYWILQIADHHLFFGDTALTRSFLPRIDGVLEFFAAHIDELGLVSGLPEDVWQYVDWVTTWGATDTHPDKGVPTSGRNSNRHTYFSLLYAYVLQQTARLVRDVGRPGYADEYEARASSLRSAVRTHCYDGEFFTDSTSDVAGADAYSQHCQLFAVLSGTAESEDHARLLTACFDESRFSKCSYMMRFYLLRAAAVAGDDVYEGFWKDAWTPWRKMLAQNLTTWEEDDVRQRSDCHAWGSVPIYEYCTELAGVQPIAPGSKKVLFKPRLGLSEGLRAKVALGGDNVATIEWRTLSHGKKQVDLRLEKPVEIVSRLPGDEEIEHGVVTCISLQY
ncbi:Six-hairpin glycosidase-like protein [Aspergillus insuetus]